MVSPIPPRIVITGSTRGLGLAERGARLVVGSRDATRSREAAAQIAGAHPHACDVTDPEAVQRLWDGAEAALGGVDIWINNAGYAVARADRRIHETAPDELARPVRVNLLGSMYGSRVAIRGMWERGGTVYNLEGFGSDGRLMTGLHAYGASKRAIHYLDRALRKELRGSRVRIGRIQPGMLATHLLLGPYAHAGGPDERTRRVLDALADPVEIAAPWIADRVLAGRLNISRGSSLRAAWRMALMPFRERGVIPATTP